MKNWGSISQAQTRLITEEVKMGKSTVKEILVTPGRGKLNGKRAGARKRSDAVR